MRGRISLIGTAVVAASLVAGVGVSLAAGHHKHHAAPLKPRAELLRCVNLPSDVPPAGQSSVDPSATSGTQYGQIGCNSAGFGGGVISDSYTIPDSGDYVGTYTQYFSDGTITGKFDLAPSEGNFGPDTFQSQSIGGQITVTGGTGAFQGVKGKNDKGTMNCNSDDSVHYNCSENVTVLIPPAASSTGTSSSKKS